VNPIRWLAALVSPLVGYLVAIAGAVILASGLKRLCPEDQMISGMCTASWYASSELAAISIAGSAGAAVFVLLPTVLAPSHKRAVALAAFVAGLLLASGFTWQVGWSFLVPFVTSAFAGGFTTSLLWRSGKNATLPSS
jgi:hypothetical protein